MIEKPQLTKTFFLKPHSAEEQNVPDSEAKTTQFT